MEIAAADAARRSPESEAAVRDIERLREEYQAGHQERVAEA
jgi:hypothetical protein